MDADAQPSSDIAELVTVPDPGLSTLQQHAKN